MAIISNSNLMESTTDFASLGNATVVLIKTEWNAAITGKLEEGASKVFEKEGIKNIQRIIVPGAFEIPFAIKNYWEARKYKDDRPHVFVALACVIRGDTPHFEYVSSAITDGILQLNLILPVPVIFGVLTVDNEQQAIERIGGKHGHKGEEAAMTALKMMALMHTFKK